MLGGVLPSFGELTTAAGISLVISASKKLLMMNEWLDLGGGQIALSDRFWVVANEPFGFCLPRRELTALFACKATLDHRTRTGELLCRTSKSHRLT